MMLLLLSAAVSCEYTLDRYLCEDETGYIYLQGLVVPGDTTIVSLYSTVPVGQTRQADIGKAQIHMTADGREVLLEKSDGNTGTVPEGVFYTSESFSPGCRLEITVSHPDLPSVRTVTEVPEMFPECSVEVRKIAMSTQEYLAMSDMNGGSTYHHSEALRVRLKFQDDPSRKDYYGLRIIRDNGFFPQSQYYVSDPFDNSLSVNMENHIMILSPGDVFGPSMYDRSTVIFSDEDFDGKTAVKEYIVPFFKDDEKWTYTYRMELIKLSDEFWRCSEAYMNYCLNVMNYYGQASIYPYTNIIGGIGAFGAISPVTVIPLEIR